MKSLNFVLQFHLAFLLKIPCDGGAAPSICWLASGPAPCVPAFASTIPGSCCSAFCAPGLISMAPARLWS